MLDSTTVKQILEWTPWLNLWSDSFILQFFIIYALYLIFFSKNIFYVVFYFFLVTFFFGLFLSLYQLELFSGFLWLSVCVVMFSFLLLLFFLKTPGTFSRISVKNVAFSFAGVILLFVVVLFFETYPTNVEHFLPVQLNNIDLFDDYYEALNNCNINDFTAFLVSYYGCNSYALISMGFLILVASIICVNLNKNIKSGRVQNISVFLLLHEFFRSNLEFTFMRQQNLTNQLNQIAASRIFKKKQ